MNHEKHAINNTSDHMVSFYERMKRQYHKQVYCTFLVQANSDDHFLIYTKFWLSTRLVTSDKFNNTDYIFKS